MRERTFPPMATGRSKMPCMPKMADCGGLIIGVPNIDPNTPPLLMVKVPPSMSSTASSFLRAYSTRIHITGRKCWPWVTASNIQTKVSNVKIQTLPFLPADWWPSQYQQNSSLPHFELQEPPDPERGELLPTWVHFPSDSTELASTHLSYLRSSHGHTDVHVVPVHYFFCCVINYCKC